MTNARVPPNVLLRAQINFLLSRKIQKFIYKDTRKISIREMVSIIFNEPFIAQLTAKEKLLNFGA